MKPLSNPEFEDSMARLLSVNLSFLAINKALEASVGLSIVQWSLLQALIRMPAVSPLALAKTLNVTPGTLSATLSRLLRKKYVFACVDPRDSRKKMISITREGKDALVLTSRIFSSIFSDIHTVHNEIDLIEHFLTNNAKQNLQKIKKHKIPKKDLQF